MIAQAFSATVLGVEAHPIEVEVNLTYGLTQFTIVGLPDGTIKLRFRGRASSSPPRTLRRQPVPLALQPDDNRRFTPHQPIH